MTKDEIIDSLCKKGIIAEIAGEYHITEKYKQLLVNEGKRVVSPTVPKTSTELNYEELLNTRTNGQDWPVEILESKGRSRTVALMDYCKIPSVSEKGKYRLKGVNEEAVNIIGNIIDSPDIDPNTMIEAITLYYQYTEMPKSFKKFVLEGDILDVYNEHIEGILKPGLIDNQDNERTWH